MENPKPVVKIGQPLTEDEYFQLRDTIKPEPEKPENWFNGKLSQNDILDIVKKAVDTVYNKIVKKYNEKEKEAPKEKKLTNNGEPEKEDDPDKFEVVEQMEVAKDIEKALYDKVAEKKVSTAYRWIVSVGYEYSLRFKPTKDDFVAHIEYKFLTISIIMVQGAHELKK